MNKDTPPADPSKLTRIPHTEAIADTSWYRHPTWAPGQFKRFRHFHTMAANLAEFEFYNDPAEAWDGLRP